MAQRQDLTIDQGSRFQWVYEVTGMSLAGMTARMHIRKIPGTDLYLDASAYLEVDVLNGLIIVDMPGSATIGHTWKHGMYDIEVYNASLESISPVRIVQGDVELDREVTV